EGPEGDIARGGGSRAAPADAAGALEGHAQMAGILDGTLATVGWEPGGGQRVAQVGDAGDPDRAAVQLGTGAALRAEGLPAQRVVDQTEHHVAFVLQRDAHRAVR